MNQPHEWLTQPGGIAEQLVRLRDAARLSGKELADTLGWAPSKVSRIERGRQTPSSADVDAWARATNADPQAVQEILRVLDEVQAAQRSWRRRLRLGQGVTQAEYNDLVRESTLIRHFDTAGIPGPLQTGRYARHMLALIKQLHGLEDDLDEAVQQRMLRQQWLHDSTKRFEFLLAEPVLYWGVCPPDVMREQLDRLHTVIDLGNIRFGILPMGVPLSTAPQNPFVMYDDLIKVETFGDETDHQGTRVADAYAKAMDLLWADAATGAAARRLIVKAADAIRN